MDHVVGNDRLEALKRGAKHRLSRALGRLDLAVVRRSELERLQGPRWVLDHDAVELPPGAEEYLRVDNPRLVELESRYQGHPATGHTQWTGDFLQDQLVLQYFRGDNAYVWQKRHNTGEVNFVLSALHAFEHGHPDVVASLGEDDAFGAFTFDVDGRVVTRDLIDSILELTFIDEMWSGDGQGLPRILDIGAGYGRLAHRATTWQPDAEYTCTDAVAVSTFISEYYLKYRKSPARVLALDEVDSQVTPGRFDLAVNIHSFSECPIDAIKWWLDQVAEAEIEHLFVVPNTARDLISTEGEGRHRQDFRVEIERRGYKLEEMRPKYSPSAAVQAHGVFPAWYFWFTRN